MTPAEIARKLTKAQREIMLGNIIDIPPEEADALQEAGLKAEAFFHETNEESRRMVWPITPLGLAVRAELMKEEG